MKAQGGRRRGVHHVVVALLLVGCASGNSSDRRPMGSPVEQVKLDVSIGSTGGPTIAHASFWVGTDGVPRGTAFLRGDNAASVAAAIAVPAARNRLLSGEAVDQACSETYGGPDVATVTGSIGGHRVATSFHRSNGCGLADWQLLAPLVGRPRWDVDHRVFQRDEPSVDVAIGGLFAIELASNATTGYAWTATIADRTVVREVDHRYLAPPTTRVGAGGYERFLYQAVASGDTTISFSYRRPSDPDTTPAADSAQFDVQISGPSSPASEGPSTTIGTTTTTPADHTDPITQSWGPFRSGWPRSA